MRAIRTARPERSAAGRRLTGLLLALGAVCCQAAADPAVLDRRWRNHESTHFRLLTDVRDRAATRRLRELERYRSVVLTVTGQRASDEAVQVDVVLLSRHRDFSALFGHGQLGFFLPTLRNRWMVSSSGALGASQRQILYHEYVHYLLATGSSVPYPPWYSEGLAELLSTVEARRGRVVIGNVPARVKGYRTVRLPITTLLFSSYASMPAAIANEFYAGSWELVHYLHAGHLAGRPNRFQQMLDYLTALQRGLDGEAAFARAFDITPLQLQQEVRSYLKRGRIPRIEFPVEAFEWSDEVRSTTPGRSEVAYRLASLALLFEPARARALLESVLPETPPGHRLHGRILAIVATAHRFEGDFDAGLAAGTRAVAAAGDDPLPRLSLANLLVGWCASTTPPADCPARLAEAKALYVEGLTLAPEGPALRYGLARLHTSQGVETAQAFATLAELSGRYPWNAGLQLQAGRSAILAGRNEEARPFLLRALNLSHNATLREEALALLQETGEARQRD